MAARAAASRSGPPAPRRSRLRWMAAGRWRRSNQPCTSSSATTPASSQARRSELVDEVAPRLLAKIARRLVGRHRHQLVAGAHQVAPVDVQCLPARPAGHPGTPAARPSSACATSWHSTLITAATLVQLPQVRAGSSKAMCPPRSAAAGRSRPASMRPRLRSPKAAQYSTSFSKWKLFFPFLELDVLVLFGQRDPAHRVLAGSCEACRPGASARWIAWPRWRRALAQVSWQRTFAQLRGRRFDLLRWSNGGMSIRATFNVGCEMCGTPLPNRTRWHSQMGDCNQSGTTLGWRCSAPAPANGLLATATSTAAVSQALGNHLGADYSRAGRIGERKVSNADKRNISPRANRYAVRKGCRRLPALARQIRWVPRSSESRFGDFGLVCASRDA